MSDDAFRQSAPGGVAPGAQLPPSSRPVRHDIPAEPMLELDLTEDPAEHRPPRVPLVRGPWLKPLALLLAGAMVGAGAMWGAHQWGFLPPRKPAPIPVSIDRFPAEVMGYVKSEPAPGSDMERMREEDIERHRQAFGGEGMTWFYVDSPESPGGSVYVEVTNGLLSLPADDAPAWSSDGAVYFGSIVSLRTDSVVCNFYGNGEEVRMDPGETTDVLRARLLSQPTENGISCVRVDWARNFSVSLNRSGPPAVSPADISHSLARATDELFEHFTG